MWGWLDTFIVLTAMWDVVAWRGIQTFSGGTLRAKPATFRLFFPQGSFLNQTAQDGALQSLGLTCKCSSLLSCASGHRSGGGCVSVRVTDVSVKHG